ncbi:unnamed protein product [Amaranthus hypochondriacus]
MWFFGRKNKSSIFSGYSTAEEVTHGINGSNLTAIVTGASNGLGAETARVLALRGVHVIIADKDMSAGTKVMAEILAQTPCAKVDIMELDLSSMTSVREFATNYISSNLPLNLLINNAGIFGTSFILSQDNIELQWATNYLGHFLLTNLLLNTMKNTVLESGTEGRIVNVSSIGHRFMTFKKIQFNKLNDPSEYSSFFAYCQSKLALILHANELSRHFQDEGIQIIANSVHPGAIYTNIFHHNSFFDRMFRLLNFVVLKDVPQGAATTCYVALHPQVKGITAKYFADCNLSNPSKQAQDLILARKLWDYSIKSCGIIS